MIWAKKIAKLLLAVAFMLLQLTANAQSYMGKSIRMAIFSSTPVEDIRALSVSGAGVLVTKTREIVVQVPIKTFEFDRKLMQEHFNENYMESDKYPLAKFKGVIDQPVDFTKEGEYLVNVKGTLSVHGVDRQRTIAGKLTIRNGEIGLFTEFKVACADHKIKIPTLIITKVAEVISVKVEGKLSPLK